MTLAYCALGILTLLPGLLLVRAPWTMVPALSLSFWTLSIWWPPLARHSRARLLVFVLAVSAALALLRALPQHAVPHPPGWVPPPRSPQPEAPVAPPSPRLASLPSLGLVLAALAILLPAALWRHGPGAGSAFQTTSARLLLWRDGIPLSAEPLLPLAPFGAHAPALATLAADVAGLSDGDPAAAVLLVLVAAPALTLVGLFALLTLFQPPPAAGVAAVVGFSLAVGTPWLELWGVGEALLGLAFLLPASRLLLGHVSRSSAVAAGMLLAAAMLAQPPLALAVLLVLALALLCRADSRRRRATRLALATLVGLLLAAPGLYRAARALSFGELRALLGTASIRDMALFASGLLLLASGLLAGRWAVAARRGRRTRAGVVAALGAVSIVGFVHARLAAAQLPAPRLAALTRLAAQTPTLDAVCAPSDLLDWIPAIAGRPPGEPGPWIPPIYRDEWALRVRRPCGSRLE